MLALVEITGWHWFGFIACVLLFLALDLGVFHRRAHEVRFREALAWTAVWFTLAMAFAFLFVRPQLGHNNALIFVTGYITELSLSMDNVFVIALIFEYFRVPYQFQHRVLFWGIVGALVMRGVMIGAGAVLIQQFQWLLYGFGILLLVAGIRMLVSEQKAPEPEKNPVIRLARKWFPVTHEFVGQKFTCRIDGRLFLTPLALVLLMVETTDLVFAVDSIPAIFGFTSDPFLVFTSNIFAILGLRSLYFVLAGAIRYFTYLKVGLSLVLAFIGVKMLIQPHLHGEPGAKPMWFQYEIPTKISLLVVAGIICVSILVSVIAARFQPKEPAKPEPPPD